MRSSAWLLAAWVVVSCVPVFGAQSASIGRYPIEVDPREYLERIELPPGFRISLYHDQVEGARSMAMGDRGTLFVGTRRAPGGDRMDKVYALPNPQRGPVADEILTVATGLNVPNGVALHDGDLYVGEVHRIIRYADIEANLASPPAFQVVDDSFPDEWHHGWKFIRFGPDGRLYVAVGAPCNICEPRAGQGTIVSLQPDGSDKKVYASGVRNSVGFDWDPDSDELWFTDNGRDVWGEDIPPEELNHAPRAGLHFGFPYRYGKALVDDEFTTSLGDADFTGAALEFPAHNALLGMRFYTGKQFPEEYHGDLFIASHGSWNRKIPDGYKIYRVRMEKGVAVDYEVFASGWLTPEKEYWGRPVDIELMADGSMLVSDDFAGVVYRISYQP